MHNLAGNIDFVELWNKLLRYSRRYKISHEDLEDIVSESIIKALEHFDADRGSFESLCLVIIKNNVFNFTRDNKFLFLLVLIDDAGDIIEPYPETFEDKESNKLAVKFIDKLKEKLDEEELNLLKAMYDLCESSDKPNISNASRLIGIEPTKGWDIFRRIQRKAKFKKFKSIVECVKEPYNNKRVEDAESRLFSSKSIDQSYFIESLEEEIDKKFIIFIESLSKENLSRLEKIYED